MKIKVLKTCPDECPSIYKSELAEYGLSGQEILKTGKIDLSNKDLIEVPEFVRCFGYKVKCLILNNNPNLKAIPEWIYMLPNLECLELVNCGLVELPDSIFQLRKLAYFCINKTKVKIKNCFSEANIYFEGIGSNIVFLVQSYSLDDTYIAGYGVTIIKKSIVNNFFINTFSKLQTNDDYNKYSDIGKNIVKSKPKRYIVYSDDRIVEDKLLHLTYIGSNVYARIGTLYSDGDNIDSLYKKNSMLIPNLNYDSKFVKLPLCKKTSPIGSDADGGFAIDAEGSTAIGTIGDKQVCFTCRLLHSVLINLGISEDMLLMLNKLSVKELQLLNLKYLSLVKSQEALTFGGLKYLKGLEYLDLSHNHLYAIPSQLENLKNLKYFILSGNSILDIPDWLTNLGIKVIDLSHQDPNLKLDLSPIIEGQEDE